MVRLTSQDSESWKRREERRGNKESVFQWLTDNTIYSSFDVFINSRPSDLRGGVVGGNLRKEHRGRITAAKTSKRVAGVAGLMRVTRDLKVTRDSVNATSARIIKDGKDMGCWTLRSYLQYQGGSLLYNQLMMDSFTLKTPHYCLRYR